MFPAVFFFFFLSLNILPKPKCTAGGSARHLCAAAASRAAVLRPSLRAELSPSPPEYVLRRFRWTMPWELAVRWCACGDCARLEELADVGPSSWRDTHSCFSPPFCCSVPHSFSFCWSLRFLISEELSVTLSLVFLFSVSEKEGCFSIGLGRGG